ncbi:MAG: CotH kinase family protein [Bacteroidaceae bacterium]|nr:CotH kinase family protein [Bacteroidaceae bacterium]
MHTFKNNIFLTLALLFSCSGLIYGQQRGGKLSGTPIGSPNWDYDAQSTSTTVNTPAHAFDGNYSTFYASKDRSRTWVGLDLGTAHVITKVGWSPRTSQTSRVQLGVFEGSNSPDFLDAVPLYLIPNTGTAKAMDYADVPVTRGFRYVRYVGPNDARCNIAELEFYGYEGEGDDSKFYQITNLPTVSIHTEAGYDPKDKVTELPSFVTITYDNGSRIQEYPITARGRGNASWGYPKKPWRIKFNDGKSHHMLKGSPLESPAKAKKWTLINNYGDKTLMRNILAFEISRRLDMPYTVYCQPVDVIMNGEYKGCYQLCDQISIDSHRVPVVEMTPDDNEDPFVTGGYLIEIDAYANQEASWFTSSKGIPITIKSPDADEITTEQSKYIKNYFNLLETDLWKNNYTDPVEGYRRRLDVESFLRHFIVGEFSGNMDTYWSTYMYKNREEDRFIVSPCWDFDLAFDNDKRIYPVNGRSTWAYLGGSTAGKMKDFVSRVLSDKAAKQRLAYIWADMRDRGLFTPESFIAYVDSTAQVLNESQKLNFIRWPIMNQEVHQNVAIYGSYEGEVNVLRRYFRERIAWIDDYLNYKAPPEYKDSTYYISNAEELMAFSYAVSKGANGSDAYLTADIDMTACSANYLPIGTAGKPFSGTFDGRSHRILNLNIKGGDSFGVFGTVTGGAIIKNFVLDSSSSISGGAFVGIVGASSGTGLVSISCVGNEANITGTAQNVAGIIGCNMGSTCQFFLSDCYNTGTISGGNESASICGWIGDDGSMQNCWNIGTVTGYNWGHDMVRGTATLDNCYSTFGDQVTSISMEPVTSGELCYKLNKGASEGICWYQTLGTDGHPMLDNSHNTVYKKEDGTYYSVNNLKGDVNGDGKVNEEDISLMADYIVNPTDPDFPVNRADMNNDGVVDVYDIVALRNHIDGALQKEDIFTARLYAANTTIKAGGTRKVSITLSAAHTATAWQADIKFGAMLSAQPTSVQSGTIVSESHIVRTGKTKDGIRVLVYSPTQEPLLNRTGAAFYFVMDADSAFTDASIFSLSNIRVAAADGSHAEVSDASYNVTFAKTYVSSIVFPESDITIMQGDQTTLTPTIQPVLATNKVLNWSTSDATIASVDQQGNVVTGTPGDAVVTATATDGSRISGSVKIRVEDPVVGINRPTLEPSRNGGEVYDLSGRKIDSSLFTLHSSLKKGVYIVKGQKVLIK